MGSCEIGFRYFALCVGDKAMRRPQATKQKKYKYTRILVAFFFLFSLAICRLFITVVLFGRICTWICLPLVQDFLRFFTLDQWALMSSLRPMDMACALHIELTRQYIRWVLIT